MENKLLSNEEAEKSVLAALLLNNENYYRANGKLNVDLFWGDKNKSLYKAIVSIIKNEKVADMITVTQFFLETKQNVSWQPFEIVELSSCIATDVTFLQNVAILCDLHTRRQYWEFGQRLIMSGIDMSVSTDDIKQQLSNILNTTDEETSEIISLEEANNNLLKKVEANMLGKENTAIHTGFRMIDDISGFQYTDLNVIAAESSCGKTSWAINIAVNAASSGTPVMIYSMEMTSLQLSARINSARCDFSSSTIQYKKLSTDQYMKISAAADETGKLPIFFDDKSTSTFEAIAESIQRNARKGNAKLFIIDYIQILCSTGKINNQEQFLGYVARNLKDIAKSNNVCIVILSQLARDRENPYPTLARIRGSGQIQEASDNVFFIYRPEICNKTTYHDFPNVKNVEGTAELIWAKGRNTGLRQCIVGFDAMTTRFYDGDFGSICSSVNIEKKQVFNKNKKDDPFPQPGQGALPF
ncbi:replicative DNA helicase [Prevotella corporis]|uniref:replicative DNA helicase n=1 Tax=Prevotella corporis TaxID=28128 RepID=UPI0023F6637D|nr:DnaB-like helicase C-terminal domain-containing protein [Prevotella corporis]